MDVENPLQTNNDLHICTLETPASLVVINEKRDSDCESEMRNDVIYNENDNELIIKLRDINMKNNNLIDINVLELETEDDYNVSNRKNTIYDSINYVFAIIIIFCVVCATILGVVYITVKYITP